MSFLRKWLQPGDRSGVALHPRACVELDAPLKRVFTWCLEGIEHVLGGAVCEADAQRGTIEASFGLVNSERLTCALEAIDAGRTRVRIESRRGAFAQPAVHSDYVRALAEFLQSSTRKEGS